MKIIDGQRPPNFDKIIAVFPDASKPGVIFAYGDEIYNPSGGKISPSLLDHEAVHGRRQKEIGVEAWWDRYLADPQFRYLEELIAHRAEYLRASAGVKSREQRGNILAPIARRLSSALYGRVVSYEQAKRAILHG